jgi:hypothetical protein
MKEMHECIIAEMYTKSAADLMHNIVSNHYIFLDKMCIIFIYLFILYLLQELI